MPSSGHSGGGRAAAPAHLCRPAGPSMASRLFGRPRDSGDTELPCLRVRTGLGPPQGHPSLAPTPSKVLRVASLRVRGWVHLRWASAASPPASEHTGTRLKNARRKRGRGPPLPRGGRHGADRTRPEPAGLETRASSGIWGTDTTESSPAVPEKWNTGWPRAPRAAPGAQHQRSARPVHSRTARGAQSGNRRPSPETEARTDQTGSLRAGGVIRPWEGGHSDACYTPDEARKCRGA